MPVRVARPARRRADPPPLTPESCIKWLLDLGLLDPEELIEEGIQVEEIPGRNRNFRIRRGSGAKPGFFLKRAPVAREDHPASLLGREAALYRWMAVPGRELARFLPGLVHYDSPTETLVLQLVGEGRPGAADPDPAAIRIEMVAGLGTALARCHQIAPDEPGAPELTGAPPWVFELGRPEPDSVRELAPAQLELLRIIQWSSAMMEALDSLRETWTVSSLIHGDIKWANVLGGISPESDRYSLYLTDWELAQWGDPAWDLGSAFHGAITEAILEASIPDGTGPGEAAVRFGELAAGERPGHRTLWKSYREARDLGDQAAEALLSRATAMMGVRFIKTAYEWCQAESAIPRRAASVLQLGLNVLNDPSRGRDLLAL